LRIQAQIRPLVLAVLAVAASLALLAVPGTSLAASAEDPDAGATAAADDGPDAPARGASEESSGDASSAAKAPEQASPDLVSADAEAEADGRGGPGASDGNDAGSTPTAGDAETRSAGSPQSPPETDAGSDPGGSSAQTRDLGAVAREQARARAAAAAAAARARRAAVRRLVRERTESVRASAQAAGRNKRFRGASDRTRQPSAGSRPRPGSTRISIQSDYERIELLPGRRDILVGRRALVRGYIPSGRANEKVVLEVYSGGSWRTVDTTYTIDDGKFYLAWYPKRPGYFRVRARQVRDDGYTLPSYRRLLYIYRIAMASWYGPGFYGNRTACGQTFTRELLGVAHRSLPCGTRLTLRYRGRRITVRVVDRGPYVDGRDYDLTEATRNYLGFDGVDEIWATA